MNEERFTVKIIYYNKFDHKLNGLINYDILTKFLSTHLIIPLFYSKIEENSFIKYLKKDFVNYLKKISNINKNRNIQLIKEIKEISSILNKHKINHLYLKGAGNLISALYKKKYIRMIGDIDILIDDSKINFAYKLLYENGYKPIDKFTINKKKNRHKIRQVNSKKIFAVELHERLFDKKLLLKYYNPFKNSLEINGIKTLNHDLNIIYNILNFQINDNGSLFFNHSHRNIYDTFLLRTNLFKKNIKKEYEKHIFLYQKICYDLEITIYASQIISGFYFLNLRYDMIKKHKILRKMNYYIITFIIFIIKSPKKFFYLIFNENYRKYLLKKLMN